MASVTIRLPTALSDRAGGVVSVDVHATSVADALAGLGHLHPDVLPLIFRAPGELRPHVHVFVADRQVASDVTQAGPLTDGDEIRIVPSIAGGIDGTGEPGTRRR